MAVLTHEGLKVSQPVAENGDGPIVTGIYISPAEQEKQLAKQLAHSRRPAHKPTVVRVISEVDLPTM